MKNLLNIDTLESQLSKGKHDVGKVMDVLPFSTKPAKEIRNNMKDVLGEFVRNICGFEMKRKKHSKDELSFESNPFFEQIISQIECTPEAEYDLERFLDQHLFGHDNNIKLIHPYLYNYVPVPDKEIFKKLALFIKDTLVQNDLSIISLFQNKNSEDILTELILDKLNIKEKQKDDKIEYQSLMSNISTLYKEDIMFLSNYKDYFLNSFPLLTHFYTFMYVCQLLMKFEQFDDADYNNTTPLYFALEWESISKRRKAADDLEGFKRIKEKAPNLFVHVHTMAQLSNNNLFSFDQSIRFQTYSELKKNLEHRGMDASRDFLIEIKEWIDRYSKLFKRVTAKEEPQDLREAFKTLFMCIREGMHSDACEKYGKNIEDLGGTVFLKNRGSLGTVLNMNHEMLLLLTSVCVKNERIPLNQLFEEYRIRGVVFDRHSKKAIIELFDSLNILDKKSDSGDAHYVKPIL